MNCHEFEGVAGDLAGERLMDAVQRENALAHAVSCAACTSRLADEQALTNGLRFVAKSATEEAPARIEAAVLAAFREQRSELSGIAPARISRQRWVYVAASVAAIALIVALLSLAAYRSRNSQQAAPQKAAITNPEVPAERHPAPQHQEILPGSPHTLAVDKRRQDKRAGKRIQPKLPPDDVNASASSAEIATDFIPLMNRETFGQMDGGQVMRVELPRSALMAFGLPMDMERATERIKADVVVGNDGLARAIRFVR